MIPSYDSKCYALAKHFIGSAPELEEIRVALAVHIQQEIESWIEYGLSRIREKKEMTRRW